MSSITANFVRLFDDAAIFPPGNLPLDLAVAEHREHQDSEYADLVGGFVISDTRLPDLIEILSASEQPGPLAINLVVTGGAGAVEPALRWATRPESLNLTAVEFALRDEEDLVHNVRRFDAALAAADVDLEDVTVYVEPPALHGPPTHGWLAALDEISMSEHRLKFRTGGATADAFPTSADLAAAIDAGLDRELAFKCTAGLHHAVRQTDPETGFTHNGFLNVLLATEAALAGGDIAETLAQTEATAVAEAARADLTSARRWFTSIGTCSVLEPHHDLVELGLIAEATEES